MATLYDFDRLGLTLHEMDMLDLTLHEMDTMSGEEILRRACEKIERFALAYNLSVSDKIDDLYKKYDELIQTKQNGVSIDRLIGIGGIFLSIVSIVLALRPNKQMQQHFEEEHRIAILQYEFMQQQSEHNKQVDEALVRIENLLFEIVDSIEPEDIKDDIELIDQVPQCNDPHQETDTLEQVGEALNVIEEEVPKSPQDCLTPKYKVVFGERIDFMKKHIPGFLAGVLVTTALLGTAAASGALTLTVTPVNIKVNNEVFQPKDVNGDDVMVFAYNGTTYAPLRALAEAYGLQVGWDQASGTATVVDPEQVTPDTTASAYADWTAEEEAAYQEFVSLWEGELVEDEMCATFFLNDAAGKDLQRWLDGVSDEEFQDIVTRHTSEFIWTEHNYGVTGAWGSYWSSKPGGEHNGSTHVINCRVYKKQPEINSCWSKEEVLTAIENLY